MSLSLAEKEKGQHYCFDTNFERLKVGMILQRAKQVKKVGN